MPIYITDMDVVLFTIIIEELRVHIKHIFFSYGSPSINLSEIFIQRKRVCYQCEIKVEWPILY